MDLQLTIKGDCLRLIGASKWFTLVIHLSTVILLPLELMWKVFDVTFFIPEILYRFIDISFLFASISASFRA